MNGRSRRMPATMSSQIPATAFRSDAETVDLLVAADFGACDDIGIGSVATPDECSVSTGFDPRRADGGISVTRSTLAGVSAVRGVAVTALRSGGASRPDPLGLGLGLFG